MATFYRIGAPALSWNTVGSWSSTSGGASNGISQPTSSDDVIFDTNSPVSVTIDSFALCLSLTLSKISLTITSNGGDLTISGTLTVTVAATINSTASERVNASGLTLNAALSGTSLLYLKGGTWTGTSTLSTFLYLDGNITISGSVAYTTRTMTYVAGIISASGSIITTNASTFNTPSSNVSWNTFQINGAVTLNAPLICNNLSNITGSTLTLTGTSVNSLIVQTSYTAGGGFTGTGYIIFKNVGDIGGVFGCSVTIDGNVTISSLNLKPGARFEKISGTVTVTASSVTFESAITIGSADIVWNNVNWYAITQNQGSNTLLTNIIIGGSLTTSGSLVGFQGAKDITCGGLNLTAVYQSIGISAADACRIIVKGGTISGGSSSHISGFTLLFDSGVSTITISGELWIRGTNLTYVSGTVVTTGSTLVFHLNHGQTVNTAGITWNNVTISTLFSQNVSRTITLTSNFTGTGVLTQSSQYNVDFNTSNGSVLSFQGLTCNNTIAGTSQLNLTGGTGREWTGSGVVSIRLNLQGNITVNGVVSKSTDPLVYVSGTIVTTGSTLQVTGGISNISTPPASVQWNDVSFTAAGTSVLTSNLKILGALIVSATSGVTVNRTTSELINVENGINISGANGSINGTAEIFLNGGTWQSASNGAVNNNLTIEPSIRNVVISGTVNYNGASTTLRYIASSFTATATGSTLQSASNYTLNINGLTLNNYTINGTRTITMTSNATLAGALSTLGNGTVTINQSTTQTMNIQNGINHNGALAGTATLILNGGLWTGTSNVSIANTSFTIQPSVSDVTISPTIGVIFAGTNLTYTASTFNVITTSSNLTLNSNSTINTGVLYWNIITSGLGTRTYTLNSALRAVKLIFQDEASVSKTFSGNFGFDVDALEHNCTVATTVVLNTVGPYVVRNLFDCYKSRVGSVVLFTSASGTTRATLTLDNNGNNLCNTLASFTRINASAGRSINTFSGTVTDCLNVNQYYDYKTIAAG